MAAKTTTKKDAKPKASVTKAQLTKAAKMRDEGATWNAIREATKTKLGSSAWFKAWEANGIPHRPAGEAKPKAETAEETPKPAAKKPRKKAAEKPAEAAE